MTNSYNARMNVEEWVNKNYQQKVYDDEIKQQKISHNKKVQYLEAKNIQEKQMIDHHSIKEKDTKLREYDQHNRKILEATIENERRIVLARKLNAQKM